MKASKEYTDMVQQAFNILLQTSRMAALAYDAHMERERAGEILKHYIETSEVVEPKEAV
jgi:hypothetical protein